MMIGVPVIIGFFISSVFWLTGCAKKKASPKGQPACLKTKIEKESVVEKKEVKEVKEAEKIPEKAPEKVPEKEAEKPPVEEKKEPEKPVVEEKKEAEKEPEKVEEKKEEEKKEPEKKEEEKKEESKRESKRETKKSLEDAKPGDPKPHITVDPMELTFQAEQQEQKKVKVTNIHDKKIMFKIKCSDITVYLINPVFATLEPGKTAEVTVTHNKTPAKEGKMVFINSVFAGDEKDLAKSFKTGKPTGGAVTVKLVAK